ncbi:MAG TPA: hypothetical protein VGR76_13615 [Candidatus Angelobacter sp.]|jgi:hypothetical protein|nr:hypothetical protein [Candidatus Angelobacter sp.]
MGWIQEHFRDNSQQSATDNTPEQQFTAAARERWRKLRDELRSDVAEYNSHRSGAESLQDDENTMRVRNNETSLELTLTPDFENHTVRYDYSALDQQNAGVPQGGMLSMRQSRNGEVEFYSADERLTSDETRQVLLEPMLFPKRPAA